MEHRELRGEIARVARQMSASGLVPTTSGNVSARTPEGNVLITPSGLAYDVLEPEDIVLVSLDGEALEGTLEPSSEVPMHTGLYRSKPHVGGDVHTHAPYATALSCLGLEIPPVHYLLAALSEEGRVPLAPYATYGTEELAGYASDALGDSHSVCLLQNQACRRTRTPQPRTGSGHPGQDSQLRADQTCGWRDGIRNKCSRDGSDVRSAEKDEPPPAERTGEQNTLAEP